MTDTKKFLIMTQEFSEIYCNPQEFSKKLHPTKSRVQSINNWINGVTKKINPIYKAKIIEVFKLPHDVWSEDFRREDTFRTYLQKLKVKEGDFDELIIDKLEPLNLKEKKMLEKKLEDIDLKKIKENSPMFMFELATKLQKNGEPQQALEVLRLIEKHPSSFKSTNYPEIEKLKAILLSDEKINNWDEAINILKKLYIAKYHKEDSEITTLIASNYKRKALYHQGSNELLSKEDVDMNLLVSAVAIHKESYNIKDSQDRYYDAINIAYLYNIINTIETEDADTMAIKELYKELSHKWKINDDDWWAVVSNAEFLMLLGDVQLAISKINDFLDFEGDNLPPSYISATFRQLRLYIHFTQDKNAIQFYEHLETCLENLQKK